MLTGDEEMMFREMMAAYRKYGMRVSVTGAPLTIDRPGRLQGQVVGLDPKAINGPFFWAEILGSAAAYPSGGSGTDADDRAYSWVERVQDAAGVWRDGTRFGEFDAYAVESDAGFTDTVAAGTTVIMRASPTVSGTWEFIPPTVGSGGGGGGADDNSLFFTTNVSNAAFTSILSLTVPTTGRYLFGYAATVNPLATGNLFTTFFVNGADTNFGFNQFWTRMTSGLVQTPSHTRMLNLTAGDVVSLRGSFSVAPGADFLGSADLWTTRMWWVRP